mmetsp:Transcript_41161/g.60947  ORF Transcript_41161/g.60947 Transcript_41161/m.60947 type:complete len:97 (+) Transcript_41161:1363-1653(+)
MLVMTVLFCWRAMSWRSRMSPTALVLSKPDVGSSSNKTFGSVSSSVPILTLFFSPPESIMMADSATDVSRRLRRTFSTSSIFCAFVMDEGILSNAV